MGKRENKVRVRWKEQKKQRGRETERLRKKKEGKKRKQKERLRRMETEIKAESRGRCGERTEPVPRLSEVGRTRACCWDTERGGRSCTAV